MPKKALAIALAALLLAAAAARADEPPPPTDRLAQRAAERGPIRRQIEAALATPAAEIAADALDVDRAEAQRAPAQAPSSSSLSWRAGTLIALACLLAAWMAWAKGWQDM